MRLVDRVAIVTGASAGIGRAVAISLARAGCDVALVARRRPLLVELAEEVRSTGRRALVLPLDVRDRAAVEDLGPEVERQMGGVDLLINNAGVGLHAPIAEAAPADVRLLFEVNVLAPIDAIRSVVPAMRRRGGGMIVNMASVAGLIPVPNIGLYCASKFAVRALSEALRVELAPDHIRVLTVYPGSIATDFGANVLGRRTRPMHRIGRGASAEGLAARIVRAIARDHRDLIYPDWYRPLWWGAQTAPRVRDRVFSLLERSRHGRGQAPL